VLRGQPEDTVFPGGYRSGGLSSETANGFLTGRYTGTDMPGPVEYDNIIEAQQTEEYCVELTKRVARITAIVLSPNESHRLVLRAPYGNQAAVPAS